jgi:hypothetical protein
MPPKHTKLVRFLLAPLPEDRRNLRRLRVAKAEPSCLEGTERIDTRIKAGHGLGPSCGGESRISSFTDLSGVAGNGLVDIEDYDLSVIPGRLALGGTRAKALSLTGIARNCRVAQGSLGNE